KILITMYEFKFPDVGEGINEGVITRWFVNEGDTVKEDQTLVEMETAKAIVEIPSPKAGKILKRNGNEGDTINVGDVLVVIDDGAYAENVQKKMPLGAGVIGELPEAGVNDVRISKQPAKTSIKTTAGGLAMPAVRALAGKLGLDLANMKGTGSNGQVTTEDVINSTARAVNIAGPVERAPMSQLRKTIAKHMRESLHTKSHVTHFDACDVTNLVALREKMKPDAEKQGIKLTYLAFITKAVAESLKEFPAMNSEIDTATGEIVLKKYYNIGIAVDTDEGLMVPVIKDADKKSVLDIAREVQTLAEKARTRKIELSDLSGGTFSITNVGSVGGTFFTPVINVGQSAILGLAAIRDEAVAVSGKVEVRKILRLGVAFDHAVTDGATAARFLNALMNRLSNPVI
ncbi:MAG: dihydrolipoamide acetyltransferase family protein, partial [Patescibacteria group bacterium]